MYTRKNAHPEREGGREEREKGKEREGEREREINLFKG